MKCNRRRGDQSIEIVTKDGKKVVHTTAAIIRQKSLSEDIEALSFKNGFTHEDNALIPL